MDKQKKQLIILVVLVAVAAVVGIIMLNRGGEAPPPPPPGADPATGAPVAGAPAAGTPAPGDPAAAAAPLVDLKKPDLTLPDRRTHKVDANATDPLRVLNADVAYKQVAKEIQDLKEKWRVTGIVIAGKEEVITTTIDTDGTEKKTSEIREIWACFFDGNLRFYREGDRLDGTYFKVKRIVFNYRDSFVEVEGDTGANVKLLVITNDRYGRAGGR